MVSHQMRTSAGVMAGRASRCSSVAAGDGMHPGGMPAGWRSTDAVTGAMKPSASFSSVSATLGCVHRARQHALRVSDASSSAERCCPRYSASVLSSSTCASASVACSSSEMAQLSYVAASRARPCATAKLKVAAPAERATERATTLARIAVRSGSSLLSHRARARLGSPQSTAQMSSSSDEGRRRAP